MFDPFQDFEDRGYLRNTPGLKEGAKIKKLEHSSFLMGLPEAINHLANRKVLTYVDFLKVHEILFRGFYPWAGQDRAQTAPGLAVGKGGENGILFAHPLVDAQRAVEEGLRLAQDKKKFSQKPGTVMGYFAYGHPFLDGNGRTMLVVHSELAKRAGFYLRWHHTQKQDYLAALTQEINQPEQGVLDQYLLPFQEKITPYAKLSLDQIIQNVTGLDGVSEQHEDYGSFQENTVQSKYQDMQQKRQSSLGKIG